QHTLGELEARLGTLVQPAEYGSIPPSPEPRQFPPIVIDPTSPPAAIVLTAWRGSRGIGLVAALL
ncbi:hypothetical protein H8D51_01920, partial [bacterium]|nr:hypothetical protein [bacterium]